MLGKHSGRHALKDRLETLGFELSKDELDFVYTAVTALAGQQEGPDVDEEIAELARQSQRALAAYGSRRLGEQDPDVSPGLSSCFSRP